MYKQQFKKKKHETVENRSTQKKSQTMMGDEDEYRAIWRKSAEFNVDS